MFWCWFVELIQLTDDPTLRVLAIINESTLDVLQSGIIWIQKPLFRRGRWWRYMMFD